MSIMEAADLNGDGKMTVVEASSFLVKDGKLHENDAVKSIPDGEYAAPEWFANIDSDNNGFIDIEELDHE